MSQRNMIQLGAYLLMGTLAACGPQPAQYGEKTAGKEAIRDLHMDCELNMLLGRNLRMHCDGEYHIASFAFIHGIAHDSEGNLYILDAGTVRKVSSTTRETHTLAGWDIGWGHTNPNGTGVDLRDGQGENARLGVPKTLVYSPLNHILYIADDDAIRQVDLNGNIKTFVGTLKLQLLSRTLKDGTQILFAPQDGDRNTARLNGIDAITIDQSGNLYIVNREWGLVKKVTTDGNVTTLYGPSNKPYDSYYPNTGEYTLSKHRHDTTDFADIAIDRSGNLFVLDRLNSVIWKIDNQRHISFFAGQKGLAGYQDGAGDVALFNSPTHMSIDQTDNLYITEADSGVIRKVTPQGLVSTVAGQAGHLDNHLGAATQARFEEPDHLTVDSRGNIFITDDAQIKKISPDGQVVYITGKSNNERHQTTLKPTYIQPEQL